MKFSSNINQFVTLMIFIFALGLPFFSQAQDTTVEIQMDKEEVPSFKIEIVESTTGDKKTAHSHKVRVITMKKSDKMVIVKGKDLYSNSKAVPANKTAVISREKSEKIDQM